MHCTTYVCLWGRGRVCVLKPVSLTCCSVFEGLLSPLPHPMHTSKLRPPHTHLNPVPQTKCQAFYDTYIRLGPALPLESRQLLAWEIVMAMSEHAAKEELVLYPALRCAAFACVGWGGDTRQCERNTFYFLTGEVCEVGCRTHTPPHRSAARDDRRAVFGDAEADRCLSEHAQASLKGGTDLGAEGQLG